MNVQRIVVLASGSGSNLQAIIDACSDGRIDAQVAAVISNNPDAYALHRARLAAIPDCALDHRSYNNRETFDRDLAALIDRYAPDLIVLAGYMRVLTAPFVQRYAGKVLNIHPSLLPKYPGLHTHRQVLSNRDKEHGSSVHFVTERLDGGPLILQSALPVLETDSEETLTERIKRLEHHIYPVVIGWFIQGRLAMAHGKAYLDGIELPEQGYDRMTFSE